MTAMLLSACANFALVCLSPRALVRQPGPEAGAGREDPGPRAVAGAADVRLQGHSEGARVHPLGSAGHCEYTASGPVEAGVTFPPRSNPPHARIGCVLVFVCSVQMLIVAAW